MPGEGLPEGLVSNKEGVQPANEGEDRVQAEQVQYLWRGNLSSPYFTAPAVSSSSLPLVYASKKTVLADNIGRRLENFFWRIWSNEPLRLRLSGTQVNILFDIINEGGFLRTTPTSSPRSSKSLSAYYKQARLRTPPRTPPSTELSNESTTLTEGGNSPSTEGPSRSSADPTVASSFAQLARLNHPEPLSSHKDIEDGSFTPTPTSPLAAVEKSRALAGRHSSHGTSDDISVNPTPTSPLAAHDEPEVSSKENKRTSPSTTRRPPILKNKSSGSSRSSQNAKIAGLSSRQPQSGPVAGSGEAVSFGDDSYLPHSTGPGYPRRPTTTRFNEEVAVSIPKPSTSVPRNAGERAARPGAEGGQRLGKRNPVVVASTGASKTRPTFARQKSSMGAPKEAPSRSPSSPSARSPKPLSALASGSRSGQMSKQTTEPSSSKGSRAPSPHPSNRRRTPSSDPPSSEELSEDAGLERAESSAQSGFSEDLSERPATKQFDPPKPLVDPDFRAKFAERSRASQRSLTNLSTFASKSSAAVPTAASFQASGMMQSLQTTSSAGKGKGRQAFTNVTAPLKGPGPAGPEAAIDETSQALPRTKSQLTLLLEKERARSTNEERKSRRTEP